MEGSWWSSRLRGEMLAIGTVFDCLNAITKERRPKIPSAHEFLGSDKTRDVDITSTAMTGIEDLFYFSVCETTTKDSINPVTIEVIADKEVLGSLVSDTSASLMIKVEGELLGSQVSKNIAIPREIGRAHV